MEQDPADLMFLYDTIRARRVEWAIEFGSGQSTLFIAQALHDQGSGHVHSLDADARWLEHTSRMMPEHLKPYVTFVHSPVVVNNDYGVPAWEYTVIPEGEWDFVLIDGPAGKGGITLSCDLIKLMPSLKEGATGMIDHRWRTAVLTKEHVGTELRMRFVPSLESFFLEKASASP